ncbi:MAG TPA: HAD hydrolase family protein [Thermoanaerobaculia bacterium]|nr:HAD hydrolase family protein [Thermoanaerobaculia bacterium]
MSPEELTRRARRVQWLLLDVDGVLTDGRLHYRGDGEELLSFDIKDGHGVKLARQTGLAVAVLSGRASGAAERRARDLGVDDLVLGRNDKGPAFAELLARHQLAAEAVAAIGDDLQDLPILLRCGLSFAPADAVAEVRGAVHHVLASPAGRGAVREMVETLLRARGAWDDLLADLRR